LNERIESLLASGRLERFDASDDEVVGIWANALQAFRDASLSSQSLRGRFTDAYDAGRVGAHAIVRCHGLRVRARNHHEMTIATAALLTDLQLAGGFDRLQAIRTARAEIEYGWSAEVTAKQVEDAAALAREILEGGARHIRAERKQIKRRIKLPE
jgi:hypothetical protein